MGGLKSSLSKTPVEAQGTLGLEIAHPDNPERIRNRSRTW